jgi:2-furoyl-CoA dehydrogenase large subunit
VAERSTWIGHPLRRTEDARFLTGRGQYLDDVVLPGMLHAAMVHSPYAHALIRRIDVSRALALPGVHGVLTGDDVAAALEPEKAWTFPRGGSWRYMAVDRVRFVGEIVAVVAAEDRALAEDAAAAIAVDYEPLPVVSDPERATDPDQPLLHPEAPGGNEVMDRTWDYGDVDAAFAAADVVVSERLEVHRHHCTPIECLGAIASFEATTGQVTIWSNIGNLSYHSAAARALRMDPTDVRMIVPDVGGHFGTKSWIHQPAVLLAVLSRKVGRPVKWAEDRLEHLATSPHGTGRIAYVDLAARRDGILLGLKMRMIDDQGAYVCLQEPFGPILALVNGVGGCYALENVRIHARCVLTNKCPVSSMRGYGRMQYFFALERMVDRVARALDLDPAAVRLKNFIPPDAYPYATPTAAVYDSGDAPALLGLVQDALDYDALRREQAEARREGRLLGIGLCAAIECAGPQRRNVEVANIQIGQDGRFTVQAPTLCQGQGHETTIAQIVADQFGVHPAAVRVSVRLDTRLMPFTPYSGSYGSRFSSAGAPAVHGAARKLRDQLAVLAGRWLEADPQDLEFAGGAVFVRGAPDRSVTLRELAAKLHIAPASLGLGPDAGLEATYRYSWPTAESGDAYSADDAANTYSVLCHAALVEIDPETGVVQVRKYVATEDCGRIINPLIVNGLTMGGVVNGLGWALTERLAYDDQGQLLTGTFMDYLPPHFSDIPPLTLGHVECPTPFGPLGAKGMAEGGAIPPPTCIANAVEDAIWHLGGRIRDSHLAPEAVLAAIRAGSRGATPAAS